MNTGCGMTTTLSSFANGLCHQDFTAAMDAVNVDLDEMRARVDSTHSIITSRQRIEVGCVG